MGKERLLSKEAISLKSYISDSNWSAAGKLSFLQCGQEAGAGGAAAAVARRVKKSEFCEKNQKRTKKIVDKNFPICIIFPSWIHFHSIIM
ncbi:hypothetical protein AB1E18_007696 [Capra hircus]